VSEVTEYAECAVCGKPYEVQKCPACGETVPVTARGTLQTHTPGPLIAGVTPKEMCVGSGVTVKGEHQ
jgi:hypothetical protein